MKALSNTVYSKSPSNACMTFLHNLNGKCFIKDIPSTLVMK